MALIECSKRSGSACVKTFEYAHIEVEDLSSAQVPAGGTSDVHRGDARFWCLRVDGYEGQSDWVDVSGVLYGLQGDDDATASATLTVGEDGGRRLRLTLRRAKRPPAGLFDDDAEISQTLELCCAAVVVDRTGLGLGVSHRDRVARPSPRSAVGGHPAVMVDASPHGGVVLEAPFAGGVAKSQPLVPAAAFAAGDGAHAPAALAAGRAPLREVGVYDATPGDGPATWVVVPRVALAHGCDAYRGAALHARQSGEADAAVVLAFGEAAPLYWTRAAPPYAWEFALAAPGAAPAWSGPVAPRAYERAAPGEGLDAALAGGARVVVEPRDEAATFALSLAAPRAAAAAAAAAAAPRGAAGEARVSAASVKLTFPAAGLEVRVPNGVALSRGVPARAALDDPVPCSFETVALGRIAPVGASTRGRRRQPSRALEATARRREEDPAQVAADGVARCKCDVRGLLVRDLAHASGSPALAFVTQGLAWRDGAPPPGDEEYFLRVAARLAPRRGAARGALAGAVEVGDAGLSLCEAALWRALAAADGARKGYAAARPADFAARARPPAERFDVDRVTCAAFSLFPVSLAPDPGARHRLARAVDDAQPAAKFVAGVLAAFPRLAISDAELHFDTSELRPRGPRSLGDVLDAVGDVYKGQLKQRWWSLASSLSLEPAPRRRAAPPPAPPPAPPRAAAAAPRAAPPPAAAGDYTVVVHRGGALGLVVAWTADGAPFVSRRKAAGDADAARALEPVAEGDALVAVGGREAAALTADELVGRMRERPLALRFRRAAPAPAAAAPAAAAPARVELTIPASEKLLGFSVGVRPSERGDCLVVTNVRARSPLDDAGVAPGARLLALNGDDVAHLSLDELTAKARPLANTDRTVVLAVDAPPR